MNDMLRKFWKQFSLFASIEPVPEWKDAREAIVQMFRKDYPECTINYVEFCRAEEERIIARLYYGLGRPDPQRIIAVNRRTFVATELLGNEATPYRRKPVP